MPPDRQPLDALLAQAGQAAARRRGQAAAEQGLTSTSMRVLGALTADDGVSHRELAARLGITPATLTPVVEGLAVAGVLTRERDPADRRVVRLSITDSGRERCAAACVAVEAAVRARIPQPSRADDTIIRAYLLAVLQGR